MCWYFIKQEAQRATYRAPEYNVAPFWGISQGGHLVFAIDPKNTNLVEDIEILLPDKFCWILFSGFRGEVENVTATQRPDRPSCFSDQPEKHTLGRTLRSCFLTSFSEFRSAVTESWKCLSQSEARAAILFFRMARKHILGRGLWDLTSCQVSLNSVQRFQRRSWKYLRQSDAREAIWFFWSAWKTQTW